MADNDSAEHVYQPSIPVSEQSSQQLPAVTLYQPANSDEDNDVIEIDFTATEIDLTNTRLTGIPPYIATCQQVETLVLRQNSIQEVQYLSQLHNLHTIDLYGNEISQLPAETNESSVWPSASLTSLDLSFNHLRHIHFTFTRLEPLKELYLVNNKIADVDAADFAPLKSLQLLELGGNRLRTLPDNVFQPLSSTLCELWLGKNKLTSIGKAFGSAHFTALKKLSLQSNRLTDIDGLQNCTALEELYVSHNGLHSTDDASDPFAAVATLTSLRVLDLSGNQLSRIHSDVLKLHRLEELWLNDNQLSEWSDVQQLAGIKTLHTLYIERNPLQTDILKQQPAAEDARSGQQMYVKRVQQLLPQLTQLDADMLA